MAITITIPDDLLAEIQAAALTEHRSVEEVAQEALRRYLDDDRSWTKWLESNREHTASLGIKEADIEALIAQTRAERRAR